MGFESFIKKYLMIYKEVNYSHSDKNQIYEENHLKEDPYPIYSLEEIINNKIQYEKNSEIKQGLKIILTLISKKNEYIKAYALGKIYFLMEDEYFKEIIVKELKNLSNYNNKKVNECAQDSLDLIAQDIFKLKIFEIFFNNITNLFERIKFNAFKFSMVNLYSKKMGLIKDSKTKIENDLYLEDYNNIFGKLISFNHQDGLMNLLDKIEFIKNENIENELLNYYHNQILEFNKINAIQELATLYSHTYRENGQLRRLEALLNDEEYIIQIIGTDALIEISKNLLKHSRKVPIPIISFNNFNFYKKHAN